MTLTRILFLLAIFIARCIFLIDRGTCNALCKSLHNDVNVVGKEAFSCCIEAQQWYDAAVEYCYDGQVKRCEDACADNGYNRLIPHHMMNNAGKQDPGHHLTCYCMFHCNIYAQAKGIQCYNPPETTARRGDGGEGGDGSGRVTTPAPTDPRQTPLTESQESSKLGTYGFIGFAIAAFCVGAAGVTVIIRYRSKIFAKCRRQDTRDKERGTQRASYQAQPTSDDDSSQHYIGERSNLLESSEDVSADGNPQLPAAAPAASPTAVPARAGYRGSPPPSKPRPVVPPDRGPRSPVASDGRQVSPPHSNSVRHSQMTSTSDRSDSRPQSSEMAGGRAGIGSQPVSRPGSPIDGCGPAGPLLPPAVGASNEPRSLTFGPRSAEGLGSSRASRSGRRDGPGVSVDLHRQQSRREDSPIKYPGQAPATRPNSPALSDGADPMGADSGVPGEPRVPTHGKRPLSRRGRSPESRALRAGRSRSPSRDPGQEAVTKQRLSPIPERREPGDWSNINLLGSGEGARSTLPRVRRSSEQPCEDPHNTAGVIMLHLPPCERQS